MHLLGHATSAKPAPGGIVCAASTAVEADRIWSSPTALLHRRRRRARNGGAVDLSIVEHYACQRGDPVARQAVEHLGRIRRSNLHDRWFGARKPPSICVGCVNVVRRERGSDGRTDKQKRPDPHEGGPQSAVTTTFHKIFISFSKKNCASRGAHKTIQWLERSGKTRADESLFLEPRARRARRWRGGVRHMGGEHVTRRRLLLVCYRVLL